MLLHGISGLPHESCGLLVSSAGDGVIDKFVPCVNAADSSRVYSIAPAEWLKIERECDAAGESIVGVMHSHTHTEPYPSATDIEQAPDPTWHYVIVSYRDSVGSLRAFCLGAASVIELPVVVS